MTEFTYRKKSLRTPKTKSTSVSTIPPGGAVTPGTFTKNLRKKTFVEETIEEVSFSYTKPVPLVARRKKDKSAESPVAKEPETKKQSPPKNPSPSKKRKAKSLSSLEQLLKNVIDAELDKFKQDYQGTNAYIYNAFSKICTDFLEEVGNIPEIGKLNKSKKAKTLRSNPENIELSRKEHALQNMIQKFQEEEKQWQQLQKQCEKLPTTFVVPESKTSEAEVEEPSLALNEHLQKISVQVDELKPVLREMVWFRQTADKFCGGVVSQLEEKNMQYFDKTDAKSLFKGVTSFE